MEIIPGKKYKIKGKSRLFLKKYGTPNPIFKVEAEDKVVFGRSWEVMDGNPAAMLYGLRSGFEGLPWTGKIFYGKVGCLGELVHESELEEIKEDSNVNSISAIKQ